MPTIYFVSQEDHEALARQVQEIRGLLQDYVASVDEDVDTAVAMRITGIKSANTLKAVREAGHLGFRKEGTKCLYSRRACIDYKRSKRLGKPTLGEGMRVARA